MKTEYRIYPKFIEPVYETLWLPDSKKSIETALVTVAEDEFDAAVDFR